MLAELSSITKTYRSGLSATNVALQDVSFTVPAGSLLGLVGPNGSGKSTSIKLLLGLIRPTSGRVRLFGVSPEDKSVFRRIGYIAENVSFSDTLKAPEVLHYHARAHGLARELRNRRVGELLEEVGLAGHARKTIRQFSKGMVQPLALACALVHDPELLILDEPMSGLDPIGRRFVIDLLARQHQAGKTICFSSHLLHDIEELCDQLVVIYRGKLIYQGPKGGFTTGSDRYRLVFTAPAALPEWLGEARLLGPLTWAVSGPAEEVLGKLTRLRESALGATILEFSREGASLEASFFELVRS